MEFLILLGPPGSGKGTLGRFLRRSADWIPVSTGEEIRKRMADPDSEIGMLSAPYMDRGDYIPDALALRLFSEIMDAFPADARVVLDGFPRTVPQAEHLTAWVHDHQHRIRTCVFLHLDPEVAEARMRNRRVCPQCRKTFPAVAGDPTGRRCDECGATLTVREDDDPVRLARRVKRHREQTRPLRDWYRRKGMLLELDASRGTEEMAKEIFPPDPSGFRNGKGSFTQPQENV